VGDLIREGGWLTENDEIEEERRLFSNFGEDSESERSII